MIIILESSNFLNEAYQYEKSSEAPPGWDFPCSAEINWPVPPVTPKSKICFLMFPVP